MKLIIAEKPSLWRTIAEALWIKSSRNWYLEWTFKGEKVIITWSFWHLIWMKKPKDLKEEWKGWSPHILPFFPEFDFKDDFEFNKKISWAKSSPKDQFKIIQWFIKDADEIFNAWDPDREWELLIREILIKSWTKKKTKQYRIWLKNLNKKQILEEFSKKRKTIEYDNLFNSAFSRMKADWIVWMNLTNLYTNKWKVVLKNDEFYPVWRVQSAVVKMIVDKEEAINNFKPETYFKISSHYKEDFIWNWFEKIKEDWKELENQSIHQDDIEELWDKLKNEKQWIVKEINKKEESNWCNFWLYTTTWLW